MKKTILTLCIFILISPLFYGFWADDYAQTTTVEHLFTHCLIAYPELAFKKENPMRENYNIDCITSFEFKNILESLYKNNYILVDINDTFKSENDIVKKTALKIPKGKKALVLSFDDVNYDHKKMGLGMVDKIILDKNNNFATQTIVNGKPDISYDREFVCILENFVKKHPDFSHNNAKGTINLTGYDGILGYRTQSKNTTNRQSEIKDAKQVVKRLKECGWNFASHSYGHYHMNKITNKQFEEELFLWKNEVEPLVGKTKIYVYPYGEWSVYDENGITYKHKLLTDYGFELFCGVGMKTFYSYLPTKLSQKVLFMDRKCVDGTTLRKDDINLHPFFKPKSIYDYLFRPSSFINSTETIR